MNSIPHNSMRYYFLIAVALLITSCFKKDVMHDRADDVETSIIYKGNEGNFIITKEEIYQATSKESGRGFTRISGYAEYRLTSYNLETGKILGRVNMGEGSKNAFIILGTSPGKIWLYSIDPALGLHCRNPKNLEVISNEKKLAENSALKDFSFARPARFVLSQYYGWQLNNGQLIITDIKGFHYYLDPQILTLQKAYEEVPYYNSLENNLNTSGYFAEDSFVSLQNGVRNKLLLRYEESTENYSYVHGQFIIDTDPLNDVKRKKISSDELRNQSDLLNDSLKKIISSNPKLENENADFPYRSNEFMLKRTINNLRNTIDDIEHEQKQLLNNRSPLFSNPLLSEKKECFYVIHAVDVTDTAKAVITKIELKGSHFSEMWSTVLNGFYSDADKAKATGAFNVVFSKGSPEFDYKWFQIEGDKLIMIAQLRMVCMDVNTGKIAWEIPL